MLCCFSPMSNGYESARGSQKTVLRRIAQTGMQEKVIFQRKFTAAYIIFPAADSSFSSATDAFVYSKDALSETKD